MKKYAIYLLALLVSVTSAYAQDQKPGGDPFHDWFTYYYLEKDSAKVPDFLKWLQQSDALSKTPNALPSAEGFLSVVFAQNPSQKESWSHSAIFTGKTKEAVDYAINPDVAPDAQEIKTTADLDKVWGAFFASGDTAYLKKVVDVLEKKKSFFGKVQRNDALHKAAAWSLGSNMTQHEAVDRFLQSESVIRKDAVGAELKAIMANVEKQRDALAFPHRDGDFSAMMFVTDPALVEAELARSSGNILHFKEMAHAKTGDKRTIVIVFAGQELSPDYKADVTYDVQLVDPAGKVYSDLKNLEGIKKKLPTRFRIFNNKAAIFIDFDSKDKPGTYTVNVVLKDNIGKKAIPLTSTIVLK